MSLRIQTVKRLTLALILGVLSAYLSARPEFQQAFNEDMKCLTPQQLEEIRFKQLMLKSPREVFANLTATASTWWYDSPTRRAGRAERPFPRAERSYPRRAP